MGAALSYCSPQQVLTGAICGDDGKGPDYMHLPCPVKYEDITREAYMSLKPELFEGLRFDVTRALNNKFALSNSLFMGSVDMPGNDDPVVKQPKAHFELGANLIDQKGKMDIVMLMGRILSDGKMSARVKYDVNDRFSIKADAQLTNEPHFSVGMFKFDYKIATSRVKSEGQMGCTFVQKLSGKISVAADFVYDWNSGEAMTSFAYDYIIGQCRLRSRMDTNYCTASYLEEKLSSGLIILLSAELDHRRKDYKFGFGISIGD